MKKRKQLDIIISAILLVGSIAPNLAWASSNVMFIFDVSEQMSGKFSKHTKLKDLSKIESTMETFEAMVEVLPKDINVGIEVYGHQGDRDCSAIEIINPLAPLDPEAIVENIQMLEPDQGSTPIAKALQQAGEALNAVKGDKTIILFSNTQDTCGGDVNEISNILKEQGISVNVLGIDVNEDETRELSGIAEASGGEYFVARNFEEMEKSLESIKEKIEGRTHKGKVVFRDDFIEDSLSSQWTVINSDTNLLKVNKGAVSITSTKKAENILHLNVPEKKNDWVFTANFNVDSQSMQEVFELGISNKNQTETILARININIDNNLILKSIKNTKKSTSHFQQKLITYRSKTLSGQLDFLEKNIQSITVKLEKVGNEYVVSARLEQLNNDILPPSTWVLSQKIKSNQLPNDVFFIKTYQNNEKNHQTKRSTGKVNLKWVEVETLAITK
ncbi:MAG: VWA domain-containing protein [Methylococcaceae bacterium]|nr:VWA domain-containing protein [Methylococcaceae bacterium]